MYYTDFVFDGMRLSECGYTICEFDSAASIKEVSLGSPLNFKTVSTRKGNRFALVDVSYDTALEFTFDICKNLCFGTSGQIVESADAAITDQEFLSITRWLSRNDFRQIYFVDDEPTAVTRYYNGAFSSISRLEIDDVLYGLRLVFVTDRPYALGDMVTASHTFEANGEWTYEDGSYLVGSIVPSLRIQCGASGTLTLTNYTTNTRMTIKNCSEDEVITINGDYFIMSSSIPTHKVWADFNYEFLKICNAYDQRSNVIKSTMPCTVTITYKPIIRDAPR